MLNHIHINKLILTLILILCALSSFSHAEPSPFGITIKKTTAEELKEKYSLEDKGINAFSKGKTYSISPEQVEFEGLESLHVIFSEDNKVLGVLSEFSKDKYNQLFDMLSSKYKLVYKDSIRGDKLAVFVDGKTKINLTVWNLRSTMKMQYVHKDFDEAYEKKSSEEKKQKNKKEAGKL
jgi:hypothetical protein